MVGQAISLTNKKYNVIILGGGAGSRMGTASEFIPKALTKLWKQRAIDYIIQRYKLIANKFIIGTSYHADLLTSYVRGQYGQLATFSYEDPTALRNNAYSTVYCLDQADSRLGTIIVFCDLIMLDNLVITDDTLYYVSDQTQGTPGTFRHSLKFAAGLVTEIINNDPPIQRNNGVLGTFVFSDTPALKAIIYSKYNTLHDLTDDVIKDYIKTHSMQGIECKAVYEFGTEESLAKLREMWENV